MFLNTFNPVIFIKLLTRMSTAMSIAIRLLYLVQFTRKFRFVHTSSIRVVELSLRLYLSCVDKTAMVISYNLLEPRMHWKGTVQQNDTKLSLHTIGVIMHALSRFTPPFLFRLLKVHRREKILYLSKLAMFLPSTLRANNRKLV